jgi:putative Ig domain-containing protein
MRTKWRWVWVFGVALILSACFDFENKSQEPFVIQGSNQAPAISGAPTLNVLEGEFYEFLPDATDPDGGELSFSISRKPAWTKFDKASGRLWGTPGPGDVGNYTNIVIEVSDGALSAQLGFDISVNPIAEGQATLSWNPPTENSDGSTLTNLGGYRIYYGRNPDNLTQVVVIDNPGLTRYVVENLSPAVWHFAMTSVSTTGVESARTGTASKTIG